jgi:flagellar biosynthesis chaperone FliJ
MRPKTRIDPVIKIEERKEERKLAEMSAAGREVTIAEKALITAQAQARADHRRTASATDWQLAELAHTRALVDVHSAEHAVRNAQVTASTTRDAYRAVHSKAEALRRVAAARVEEILTARAKAEGKELDELGVVMFNSRNSAA